MKSRIPFRVRMKTVRSVPWARDARRDLEGAMDVDEERGAWTSSTGSPRGEDRYHLAAIPVPASPRLPVGHSEWEAFCDEECEPSQARVVDWVQYDQLA